MRPGGTEALRCVRSDCREGEMTAPDVSYLPADDRRPASAPEVVHERLLPWYERHGRDLPWRRTRDPYRILVSEMMLQQTGVERVLPKYALWLERFPTLQALADAPRAEVIRLWSGLGYNSRAVRLQEIAREAVARYGGSLPDTLEGLRALKGIGPYTAGAILCFAHERDVAFVDTNIRRVLSRVFLDLDRADSAPGEKELYDLAGRAVPPGRAWIWYQALMDLGATICVDGKPACLVCPLQDVCRNVFTAGNAAGSRRAAEARASYVASVSKEGPWRGSTRYYRGRIVAALGALPAGTRIGLDTLGARIGSQGAAIDPARLRELVTRLAADGLVALHERADGTLEAALPE